MVSKCPSAAAACCILGFLEFAIGSNMALYISDKYILYYQMDECRSFMLDVAIL